MRPMRWNIVKYYIDGLLLERWFLKTTINLASLGDTPVGEGGQKAGGLDPELVRAAYGETSLSPPAGLYLLPAREIPFSDSFDFTPLVMNQSFLTGAVFTFRGLTFMLFLAPYGVPDSLNCVEGLQLYLGDDLKLEDHLHPEGLDIRHGKYMSHRLVFSW